VDYSNQENNQQLAEVFRKHRTAKGMTVEEAASKTGIPSLHINSIENGKFEQFDPFYLKMYLKKYGTFLTIDLDEAYAQAYGAPQVEEAPVAIKAVKSTNSLLANRKTSRRSLGLGKLIGMLLLVIAIGYGGYVIVDMWQQGMSNDAPPPVIENPRSDELVGNGNEETDDTEEEPEEEAENVVAEPALPATHVELVSQEGNFQNFTVHTEGDVAEIQFIFSNRTAISPLNSGAPIAFDEMTVHPVTGAAFQDGDTATITLESGGNLEVWFQWLNYVEATVNGEPVELAEAGDWQVLRFEIE